MNCLALAAKSTVRGRAAQYCMRTDTSTVSLSVGGSAGQRPSVGGATARRHGTAAYGSLRVGYLPKASKPAVRSKVS